MVAHERKRDDADGLEDAVVYEQASSEWTAQVGRLHRPLSDDGKDDDDHGDQGETACFGELFQSQYLVMNFGMLDVPWQCPGKETAGMKEREQITQ